MKQTTRAPTQASGMNKQRKWTKTIHIHMVPNPYGATKSKQDKQREWSNTNSGREAKERTRGVPQIQGCVGECKQRSIEYIYIYV